MHPAAYTASTNVTVDPTIAPRVHVAGLVAVIVFYLVILFVGLFATWRSKSWKPKKSEDVMIAGRSIGVVVGLFTMTGEFWSDSVQST